ncbi:FAD-dependent monooxygenase [Nocardia abscessus]|uniref:FAD-dependent monooxygenase n=1 Tax=Nocardia abscessus TaxID=120957 RepID=UPI001892DB04|nr:FAD-dependent monooxygenase [Nocardia abscessus]MBF6339768.1 FAD-dependent monooxygenase [Nocardia abscessus]
MSHDFDACNRIVIVGAGPVGLMLAIQLRLRGVECRVIDQASGPAPTSRACVVHARSLELLAQAGIVDPFLEQGRRALSMDYHFFQEKGVEVVRLDFTQLQDSRYPFMLTIPQNRIEQILGEYLSVLGGEIEWNIELRRVATDSAGVPTAQVIDKTSGRAEVLHPQWLMGCDGLHSTVRRQMGIGFVGGEYTADWMRMGDTPLAAHLGHPLPLPDDRLHYLIGDRSMVLLIRLPGPNYRVLVSDLGKNSEAEITREAFQRALDDYFPGTTILGEPEGAAKFYIRNRVADTYRRGNVFLAGDAAHIHSPAGAQGLLLGLQDAANLGWRLALVAKAGAHESVLDGYEPERIPVATRVIERTKRLHDLLMNPDMPIADRLAILRAPGFTQQAVEGISGISTTYRHTAPDSTGTPRTGLLAGDRAPDIALTSRQSVHHLLHHPGHTVLAFQRTTQATPALVALRTRLAQRFGDRVRMSVITSPQQRSVAPSGAVIADTDAAHKLYGADDTDTLCLLRPDAHIHQLCGIPEQQTLLTALGAVLT